MSSVPVQFLIYVLANLSCYEVPVILPFNDCLEVQVGTSINLTLYVLNHCNTTNSRIVDMYVSMEISGVNISRLFNSTTNASLSYITLHWTPQSNQIGSQQFCAAAYTKLFFLLVNVNRIVLFSFLVRKFNLMNTARHS